MSKAKKKIASAFADSKVGKKIINKTLGPSSTKMIKALKNLLIEFYGKKEAKSTLKNIYKFSVKANMIYESNKIDMAQVESSREDIKKTFRVLMDLLNEKEPSNYDRKLEILSNEFEKEHEVLKNLLNPHFTDKNVKLFDELSQAIHDKDFIKSILVNPKNSTDKEQFRCAMHEIMILNDKDYALSVNSNLDEKTFNEQYKKEIQSVIDFWTNSVDNERLAFSVFNRLLEINPDYYNSFQDCIKGDNPESQHDLLAFCMHYVVQNLNKWDALRNKLQEIGRSKDEWGHGLPPDIFNHMNSAFHRSMVKCFPSYKENDIIEDYTILLRIILHVLSNPR